MIGFELNVKGEVFKAALYKGVLTVILTKHHETIDVHFGGLDTDNDENIDWLNATLELDEEIKVKVKDIFENSEPERVRRKDRKSQDELDLQKYYSLKKKLEEKGLI
ncbi:hypothetical protein [Zunongwangia sp. HRR-M8]|uniref:hypothetical protein n=1 Tax=Zunongwangia sp. HRR-M8 TaxID=3015170 RepID=UPI0022DE841F|nr:hypothetical protein [Zunongwangia sp. HRR-M8]WBL23373.1 hypothetical protein PBT89_05310 [Zunongwangia sp. HRR-M8]